MSAQETAEAILIVVKKLSKWFLYFILGLIAFGICAGGVYKTYEYFTYKRYQQKVLIKAEFNKKECSKSGLPLYIFIGNGSEKKILNTSLYIEVTHSGRSTKLNDYQSYESDIILDPSNGFSNCYPVFSAEYDSNNEKKQLDGIDMTVKVTSYDIKFEN